jgi:hypothetical protein
MKVEKKLSFADYWHDPAFARKRVDVSTARGRCGDNIYEPLDGGSWKQHPSLHSQEPFGNVECESEKKKDLSGKFALIAREFVYHGAGAIPLPAGLASVLTVARGYRNNFDEPTLRAWEEFMATQPRGRQGDPSCLPGGVCSATHAC